jgi:hypothetical protein
MATDKKGRKVGRSKRNGQASRYKNEFRCEQNKLTHLYRHIKNNGVTGQDVLATVRLLEIKLGRNPSNLKVNEPHRSAESRAWYKANPDHARIRKERSEADRGIRSAPTRNERAAA